MAAGDVTRPSLVTGAVRVAVVDEPGHEPGCEPGRGRDGARAARLPGLGPRTRERRDWLLAVVVCAVATLVRLVVAARFPLVADETYYWEWSRRLAGGYFDHPHGIATLVRAGTTLWAALGLAPTALAVRLGPVLAGGVATLVAAAVARRVGGGRAALWAAVVVCVLPLAATGLVLATPDAPLLGATAVSLYFVVRALQARPRSRASTLWWVLAGGACGLAFSAKLTGVLLPLGVLVALAARRDLRGRFAEPGPYLAVVAATAVFSPVLVWNARHEWVAFTFQLAHGLGAASKGNALLRELELFGGQLGLAFPVLFVLMAIATWRALRGDDAVRGMLAIVALVTFGFFVYSALRRKVEPNWPAPAYLPAAVLLATHAWGEGARRWLRAGCWIAGALAGVVYLHAAFGVLPMPARRDPVAKAFGWDQLGARVWAERARVEREAPEARVWVAANRYQDASEISFHLARSVGPEAGIRHDWRTSALSLNVGARRNQYELWPQFADLAQHGDALVLALDDSPAMHEVALRLAPHFAALERGAAVALARGGDAHATRRVYVLRGWSGGWPSAK